mmetsp:Transcript_70084/g.123884  ORF Transcript_70084/g.123884 Transcript_70084/m.123884 type:complete len:262 (-) Transcript_70084:56-841(-)
MYAATICFIALDGCHAHDSICQYWRPFIMCGRSIPRPLLLLEGLWTSQPLGYGDFGVPVNAPIGDVGCARPIEEPQAADAPVRDAMRAYFSCSAACFAATFPERPTVGFTFERRAAILAFSRAISVSCRVRFTVDDAFLCTWGCPALAGPLLSLVAMLDSFATRMALWRSMACACASVCVLPPHPPAPAWPSRGARMTAPVIDFGFGAALLGGRAAPAKPCAGCASISRTILRSFSLSAKASCICASITAAASTSSSVSSR